jgi:hypothetical protein
LIERIQHLSKLDVRSLRAADYDTDHYLVVAKVKERLAVSKQTTISIHMERFNLKKLKEVEARVPGYRSRRPRFDSRRYQIF